MKARSLLQLAELMGGSLLEGSSAATGRGVAIDSRCIERGDVFFALPGAQVHGIDYIPSACHEGASAIVVDRDRADDARTRLGPDVGLIAVRDPARALGRLTARVRTEERSSLPTAAITGSVGKTTVCRYAAHLLEPFGIVHRPPSSFNNHSGVPLTVLNAPDACDFLVTEVGSNASGEVFELATWIAPHIAVVTAVAPVHLEGFGSVEAIEVEKLSILDALVPGGQGWIPKELADRNGALLKSIDRSIRTLGPGGDLEIHSSTVMGHDHLLKLRHLDRRIPFEWQAPFPHSPRTLEAALAIGLSFGIDAEALLSEVSRLSAIPLRGEMRRHGGVDFLLDCYNANPASMESAIERLENESVSGRRVCVVGTMEELGEEEQLWHQRIGERLASPKVDSVYLLGRGGDWYDAGLRDEGRRGEMIENDVESAKKLAALLSPGDCVLFKASRREALETFADRVAEVLETEGN